MVTFSGAAFERGVLNDEDKGALQALRRHRSIVMPEEDEEGNLVCSQDKPDLDALADMTPHAGTWVAAMQRKKSSPSVVVQSHRRPRTRTGSDASQVFCGGAALDDGSLLHPSLYKSTSQVHGTVVAEYFDIRRERVQDFNKARKTVLMKHAETREALNAKCKEDDIRNVQKQRLRLAEHQRRAFSAQQQRNEQQKAWRELQREQERAWAAFYNVPFCSSGGQGASRKSTRSRSPGWPSASPRRSSSAASSSKVRRPRSTPAPTETKFIDEQTQKENWKIYEDVSESHKIYTGTLDRWRAFVHENERRAEAHWRKLVPDEKFIYGDPKCRKLQKAVVRVAGVNRLISVCTAKSLSSLPSLGEVSRVVSIDNDGDGNDHRFRTSGFASMPSTHLSPHSHAEFEAALAARDAPPTPARARLNDIAESLRETNLERWREKESAILNSRERRRQRIEGVVAAAQRGGQESEARRCKSAEQDSKVVTRDAFRRLESMEDAESVAGRLAAIGEGKDWDSHWDSSKISVGASMREELFLKAHTERVKKLASKEERSLHVVRERNLEMASKARSPVHAMRTQEASDRRMQYALEFHHKTQHDIASKLSRSTGALGTMKQSTFDRHRAMKADKKKIGESLNATGESRRTDENSGVQDMAASLGLSDANPLMELSAQHSEFSSTLPVRMGTPSTPPTEQKMLEMSVSLPEFPTVGTPASSPSHAVGRRNRPTMLFPEAIVIPEAQLLMLTASAPSLGGSDHLSSSDDGDSGNDGEFLCELKARSGKWLKDMRREQELKSSALL